MPLFTAGINHHQAPLAVREQVAFGPESLPIALADIATRGLAEEIAIVSTCNRTELIGISDHPAALLPWLADFHKLPIDRVAPHGFTLEADAAVKHVFRVAAGLDSMVLGETQIVGQIKDAARTAQACGTTGTILHHLFQRAFSVAKAVRSKTEIGTQSVSMAAAAVKLAGNIFPDFSETTVLLIGAGEMITLCGRHFADTQPKAMFVANRTLERGQSLAQTLGAESVALQHLPDVLVRADIVISCTASTLPIIGKGLMERVLKERRFRPIFIVDLAVPRDVEVEISRMDDVYLYTIDDMASLVQAGQAVRLGAREAAESLIETELSDFIAWLGKRENTPTIRALRDHGDRLQRLELEKARKQLARGDDPEKVLRALAQTLTNKFLHEATQALQDPNRPDLQQLVRTLYHLPDRH